MSTATVASSYTTRFIESCATHTGNSCVEITLASEPEGEQLPFVFATFRHRREITQIGVIEDLLMECHAYRAPSGFDVMNGRTVHFHYRGEFDTDVLFDACSRLKSRLDKCLEEITTERNATHWRDPQTHLVHKH